jgi:RNA 3'-terminal phosphate cyclase (ATP)
MLALSVLPLACFADSPIRARIEGGVFQDFAPAPHREVLAPLLRRMGVEIDIAIVRPGYVPGGAGILQIAVTPAERGLIGLNLVDPGQVRQVHGIALASHLAERRVSERMAATCEAALGAANLVCDSERRHDKS